MRSIEKPNDDPRSVYLTCISRVRNPGLKTRLESVGINVQMQLMNMIRKRPMVSVI